METGKTTRYFKYAIGEILLVVIGILIALQFNNWNEENKTRSLEIKILKELKSDLIKQREDIVFNIDNHKKGQQGCLIIREALLSNQHYHDSLNIYFTRTYNFTVLNNNQNAYKIIESKSISLIRNDSLRFLITNYYEQSIPFQLTIEKASKDIIISTSEKHLKIFKNFSWINPIEPWDFESLKSNKEYISWLNFTAETRAFEISKFQVLLEQNKRLTKEIDLQLKQSD
jgi:hypothetical protein